MIGPGLFSMTFASFIGPAARWQVPGAPFFLASFLLALAWLVGLNVRTAGQTAGHAST
jgi:MFS transporter, DHA1 family, tetracycline resistance protein